MHIPSEHKRILFVSHDASLTGAPIYLSNLLKYMQSSSVNYDIVLHCANNGPLVQTLQKEGFRVITFGKRSSNSSSLMKAFHRLGYYLNFMALLNQFKPDLIYSNTMVNFSQVVLGRVMGAKILVHMHEGNDFASRAKLRLKFSSFFTTKYIVGSRYVAAVLKNYVGIDGVVIYNGIKAPASSQDTLGQQKTSFSLCVIGTIDRNKAQLIAVKAVEYLVRVKHLDVQLKIVGRIVDAEYGDELNAYIKHRDLCAVVALVGPVENIEDTYKNADALIVPSLDEAFPTVILEAMALKKSVIASNTGGIPEIIQDGETGLLFERGNFMDLAGKIILLINDDRLRLKIISNAFLKIKTNFSFQEQNRKIVQEIDNVFS